MGPQRLCGPDLVCWSIPCGSLGRIILCSKSPVHSFSLLTFSPPTTYPALCSPSNTATLPIPRSPCHYQILSVIHRALFTLGFSLNEDTSLLLHTPIHVTSYEPSILWSSGELLPACSVTIHQFRFCSPPLALANQRKLSTIQWIIFQSGWTPVMGSSPHSEIVFPMEPLLQKIPHEIFFHLLLKLIW